MLAMQEQENTGSIRIRRIHSRGTSPAAIILDYAIQQDIDLIVMGTHGHRGLKKIILGSTALEVIRRAPCDVLTVNNNTVVREFQDSSRSMLVPVDLSDKSELLLQEAVDIAKKMSYHIDLLHIVESPFVPALGLDASDLYRMLPSRKKQASEHVDKLVAGLGDCGVSINVLVRDGQPSTLINALAKELQSELIVMAPGTTTWFERVPLGSVSEHILSSAPCPVYMLPASQNDSITDDMEKEDLTTT